MSFSSERFTMFLQLAVRKMAAPRSANLSNNSKSQDGNPATEIYMYRACSCDEPAKG
jgi:hypothetical protein